MGMNITEQCEFCVTQHESAEHLFFHCTFTASGLQMVKRWLGWHVKADSLLSLTRWLGRSKLSRFRKNFFAAVLTGLVYNLWKARNLCVWEKKKLTVAEVFERTRSEVLQRVQAIWPKKVSTDDTNWFQNLIVV
uniref:Reverse transcriptase zinc-binding domain-containing protein n=1 Tax=Cannabis sativa TaxID=3483 RepID=A0A803RCE1_CANSA